jgi:hypothetical protein
VKRALVERVSRFTCKGDLRAHEQPISTTYFYSLFTASICGSALLLALGWLAPDQLRLHGGLAAVLLRSPTQAMRAVVSLTFGLRQQGIFYPFVYGFALDERKTVHKKRLFTTLPKARMAFQHITT